MNTEIQVTVEILRLTELLRNAIKYNHPTYIIKFYEKKIDTKNAELEMLQTVEHVLGE